MENINEDNLDIFNEEVSNYYEDEDNNNLGNNHFNENNRNYYPSSNRIAYNPSEEYNNPGISNNQISNSYEYQINELNKEVRKLTSKNDKKSEKINKLELFLRNLKSANKHLMEKCSTQDSIKIELNLQIQKNKDLEAELGFSRNELKYI